MPATVLNVVVVVVYGLRRHGARNPRTRNLLRVHAALLRSLVIFLTRIAFETPKEPQATNSVHRLCEFRCSLARKGRRCEAIACHDFKVHPKYKRSEHTHTRMKQSEVKVLGCASCSSGTRRAIVVKPLL